MPKISPYVFCELIPHVRDKDGQVIGPTVGPSQHIARCMAMQCECDTYWRKVREMRGEEEERDVFKRL
jgi:hypothetical protein